MLLVLILVLLLHDFSGRHRSYVLYDFLVWLLHDFKGRRWGGVLILFLVLLLHDFSGRRWDDVLILFLVLLLHDFKGRCRGDVLYDFLILLLHDFSDGHGSLRLRSVDAAPAPGTPLAAGSTAWRESYLSTVQLVRCDAPLQSRLLTVPVGQGYLHPPGPIVLDRAGAASVIESWIVAPR